MPSSISGATYDAGNRLSAWNGTSVTHDLNGNMTAALGQTYTWNERNQLTASTGSVSATFAYDSDNRRRARTVNGSAVHFLYDGQQPIQELTSGNALSAELLTGGIDEIFSRSAGGATQTFIVDALGSTVRLTDTAGAKEVDYTYEAYGKASNDNASNTNTFQYTGRENDGTQLQFNRARYYDPRLARFISEDPIGLMGGYNLFSYVEGNPISLTDPDGLSPSLPGSGGMSFPSLGGGAAQCNDPKKEKNCTALRDNIINQTCKSITNPKKKMACFAAAWATYLACLSQD